MEIVQNENRNGILFFTINRPKQLNALNRKTLEELNQLFLDAQNEEYKGIIITGSGEKAFVAGADISEIKDLDGTAGHQFSKFGQEVFNRIESNPKPVIALINGFALGGGLELAMSCHIRVAVTGAKMGQPETKLGVIPGYGGTQRLPRLIGVGRAMELILSGKMIDAETALQFGLVNSIAEKEESLQNAIELIETISQNAPKANARAIEAISKGMQMGLKEALAYEATLFGVCCSSSEKDEGIDAFLEKRKAKF